MDNTKTLLIVQIMLALFFGLSIAAVGYSIGFRSGAQSLPICKGCGIQISGEFYNYGGPLCPECFEKEIDRIKATKKEYKEIVQ